MGEGEVLGWWKGREGVGLIGEKEVVVEGFGGVVQA